MSDLDHGGDGMDTAQILDNALGEVSNAQADGPVGVSLQPDHLIGTEIQNTIISICLQLDVLQEARLVYPGTLTGRLLLWGKGYRIV